MKSKKWIALAMMAMCVMSLAGALIRQFHGSTDSSSLDHMADTSVVQELLNHNRVVMNETLKNEGTTVAWNDDLSVYDTEIEIIQLEVLGMLMTTTKYPDKQDAEDASEVEEETVVQEETSEEVIVEETTAPSYVIPCTEDEYRLLCRLVEAEAGNTDVTGRIMVANVIINRVRSNKFPNSIYHVVYASGQFMPITTGAIWKVNVSSLSEEAVYRALLGEDYSQGATYFSSTGSASAGNWHTRVLNRLFEYGGNVFFKEY